MTDAPFHPFEIIDHTAEIGIAAYGRDLPEAFANAAHGMFSLMVELDQVAEDILRDVRVEANDQEELLVRWLNELLFIFDTENLVLGDLRSPSLQILDWPRSVTESELDA